MFENGQYRHMTDKDTAGSWALAILLTIVIMLPFWLLWKIIQAVFFSSKNKNK